LFALATALAVLAVGSVSIVVTDAGDAVLPGVEVRLVDSEGAVTAHVLTDIQGAAQLPRIRAGKYEARVNLDGFQTRVVTVLVSAGAPTVSRVMLEVAPVHEIFVYERPRARILGPRCTERGHMVPHP
jgi:hypothetical protein